MKKGKKINLEELAQLNCYEIYIPVKETWIFQVYAKSKEEAMEKYLTEEKDQICSIGGWPNCNGAVEVRKK